MHRFGPKLYNILSYIFLFEDFFETQFPTQFFWTQIPPKSYIQLMTVSKIFPEKSIFAIFSIWKLVQMLIRAHIKIVAHAIYTYMQFFSHTCTLLFCWKKKVIVVITVFFSKLDRKLMFQCIYYKTVLMWLLVSIWLISTHWL